MIKLIIKKYLNNLVYFYNYLGYRLFLMIFLGILVGVLDGFGLAMFMPLLEMVNDPNAVDGSSMGNLQFLVNFIQNFGLSLNLVTVLVTMMLFFIVKGLVKFTSLLYNAGLRRLFIRQVRAQLLSSFNRINYKYFVTADVGRIQNTMSVEVERTSGAFYNYANALQQFIMMLVYMSFAFFIDFKFALLVSVGGGLTNFLYKAIYKRTKGTSKKFSGDSHIYQGLIIQYVANFKYLKATGWLWAYADRLNKSIITIENNRYRIGKLSAILEAAREPILIIVVVVVIFVQTQFLNGQLGPILISLLFFYRSLSSLLNLQSAYNRFLEQYGSLENVYNFQKEVSEQKERNGEISFERFEKELALENVFLSYEEKNVLRNITLHIKKNETVAFIGESGSGKTTLVNVIAGLLQVDKGKFLIDGENALQINMASYQNKIGYITQDPVIFNDSIYNNITLWAKPTLDNLARFEDVIKKASIADFVYDQPDAKDSLLGNNGINLSGGQKQRISIARELFKDIEILIMDEATSALDTETERAIQTSIDNLKGKYTIFMVAHRLSTIKNADKIILMNNGVIESLGNFDQLLQTSERFVRMISLQELSQ